MKYPVHYISTHALERFRQWTKNLFSARSDDDLIELIDSAIITGTKEKKYETIIDEGRALRLYDLKQYIQGAEVHALVGPNLPEYQSKHKEAIISMLTPENVERSRSNGRWVIPFNGFADKLHGVIPFQRPEPPPSATTTVEASGAALARAMLVQKNQRTRVAQLEGELHDAKQDLLRADADVTQAQELLSVAVANA